MKKSIYSMLLTALLGLTGMNAWALDQVDGVYQIATAADLVEFASIVNGGQYDANAVLTADIDMTGADISKFPIGTGGEKNGKRYTGTFDGQKHRIYNFQLINANASNNFGMFNTGANVVLKDFWLDNSCKIQGKELVGLIGRHDGKGTFEGVGNCADVTGTNNNVAALFGGVWGKNNGAGSIQTVIIKNCWTTGTVLTTNTSATNYADCGALAGWFNNVVVNIENFWTIAEVVNPKASNQYVYRNGSGASFTLKNCYSKNGSQPNFTAITENETNGELCYMLNESLDSNVWFQNLDNGGDVDEVPVPFSTHGTVYKNASYLCPNTIGGDVAYSNTNSSVIPDHDFVDGFCTVCGSPDGTYIIANGEGYYEIDTPAQLKWFAAFVNAGNTSANAKLTADLDMTDVEVAIIGNSPTNAYQGTFDGQGHEISNYSLTYNGTLTKSYGYGMFGNTNGATIKNFTIDGSMTFNGTSPGDLGCALVGWPDGGTLIQNIKSSINIDSHVYSHIGGIVGSLRTATIDRCEYAGHLNGYASGNGVAGIAGYTNNGTITNCIFSGTVEGTGTGYYTGILGYVNSTKATMKNCLSCGTVTNNNSSYVGALVARLNNVGTYSNNYYIGTKGIGGGDKAADETIIANSIKITTEQLASGEACYFLNGNQSEIVFYQTLPGDDVPTFDATHGTVYAAGTTCPNGHSQDVSYSNTPGAGIVVGTHNFVDGFCIYCETFDEDYMTDNDGIFEIGTPAQLRWFASYVNAGNPAANAILTTDIDLSLSSVTWEPIGNASVKYTGTFDGQGHAITNFSHTATADYNGLFGFINNATVKNFSISGELTSNGFTKNGVIGSATGTAKVIGIHSSLEINVSDYKAHSGGIVGGDDGSTSTRIVVEGCEYSGTMTHSGTGDCQAGIMGYTGYSTIRNCIFSGTINGETNKYGGILGYCNKPSFGGIHNCLSIGKIVANEDCTTAAAIIGNWNTPNATSNVKNNYYCLKDGSTTNVAIGGNNAASITEAPVQTNADKLASGEVTAKLGIAFRQNIGTDANPVLDATHNVVAEITEAGYATLYVPDTDVTIPDGVEAYTGVILNEGWLHLNDVTEKIAAEEAVVLAGEAGIYSFVPTTGATKDDDNVLKGSAEDIAADGKYVLAKPNNDAVGFYLANAGTIKAGKAYLESASGVKGFIFKFDDETTAIAEIENGKLKVESSIYNLAGQMVNGKLPKGIYIVGGKKRLF